VGQGILEIQRMCLGAALRVPGLGVNIISESVLQRQGCKT
jgi:hypothetical protein